jgi:hypothetical protein
VDTIDVPGARAALVLVIALAATVAGCRTEYVVDVHLLEAARQETSRSGHSVAVPVERMNGGAAYVRYDRLDLASAQPLGPGHVMASAPSRRGYRIAGPILLSFGLAALVSAVGVVAGDFGSSCQPATECWRGLLAGVVGLPLGVGGILLTIPGAVLTHRGYRDPSEVVPSQRDLLYLSR